MDAAVQGVNEVVHEVVQGSVQVVRCTMIGNPRGHVGSVVRDVAVLPRGREIDLPLAQKGGLP
eukprot:4973467-Karenia_brevis.AAC.1